MVQSARYDQNHRAKRVEGGWRLASFQAEPRISPDFPDRSQTTSKKAKRQAGTLKEQSDPYHLSERNRADLQGIKLCYHLQSQLFEAFPTA